MVRNLVSNAIKHGASDSAVWVALRGEEAEIRLEVTNSGPAIEADALREIFDPLKRGTEQDVSRDAPGSLGLGLFIVREIAGAHGGRVEARSNGQDTTFVVQLPRGDRLE